MEVVNAIKVYENLNKYKFANDKSFLKAHLELMTGLIETAGKYRKQSVGIVKGNGKQRFEKSYRIKYD